MARSLVGRHSPLGTQHPGAIEVPYNFSWVIENQLAAIGMPGCGLELAAEMLPHERKFLSWLLSSSSRTSDRAGLAKRIGLHASDPYTLDRRTSDLYKKFRDIWKILRSYWEGFGDEGEPVDRFTLDGSRMKEDLDYIQRMGIRSIVSLTEDPLDEDVAQQFGFEILHIPVPDRKAPRAAQIDRFVGFTNQELQVGRSVLVHCLGGYGWTGTFLACYLVHNGSSADQAIAEIRSRRPGSIDPGEQEEAVCGYEEQVR